MEDISFGRSESQCQLEKVDNSGIKGKVPLHGDKVDVIVES